MAGCGGLLLASAAVAAAPPVRAAYIYDHMDTAHLDSLAATRFNRVVLRMLGDSLDDSRAAILRSRIARGRALGIEVVLDWTFEAPARLVQLGTPRRYTWGLGNVEPNVACPLDSAYWQSALIHRAEEILGQLPEATQLAIDLEIHAGRVSHFAAGPCRCPDCLFEYTRTRNDPRARETWRLTGMLPYQESRLTRILNAMLAEFAARHPGVELAVFDLDLDSFVHRSLARALSHSRIPTANYCERSYAVGGAPLWSARGRLQALGLGDAQLLGGLWLKRFTPQDVPAAVRSITDLADGYFIFTTYSLWVEPSERVGPYVLLGPPGEYWEAFAEVNQLP
jgi:hypothetical protein